MFRNHSEMTLNLRERMRDGIGQVQLLEIIKPEEFKGKCRMFSQITLEPGCSIGKHVHEQEEEIFYVISGNGTVDDNGSLRDVGPGDALKTGGGEYHSVTNTGDVPLVLIAVILLFAD